MRKVRMKQALKDRLESKHLERKDEEKKVTMRIIGVEKTQFGRECKLNV